MQRDVSISKTLSFWLRHRPDAAGLSLDTEGWTDVRAVLTALGRDFSPPVTEAELAAVVSASDKQRFMLRDGRIRANQGHSLALDLAFRPVEPPPALYHGTTRERWERIRASGGLSPMQRHHVHLSPDLETARRVATHHRKQTPLVLRVDASAARAAGHAFFISDNGVYLVDAVPLAFLSETDVGGKGAGD